MKSHFSSHRRRRPDESHHRSHRRLFRLASSINLVTRSKIPSPGKGRRNISQVPLNFQSEMLLLLLLNFIYRTYRRASFPCNNPFPSLGVNSGSRGERFKFIRPRRRRKSWGTIDYEASRDFASNRGRAVEIKTSLAYRNWLETIAGNRDVSCVRLLNGRVVVPIDRKKIFRFA